MSRHEIDCASQRRTGSDDARTARTAPRCNVLSFFFKDRSNFVVSNVARVLSVLCVRTREISFLTDAEICSMQIIEAHISELERVNAGLCLCVCTMRCMSWLTSIDRFVGKGKDEKTLHAIMSLGLEVVKSAFCVFGRCRVAHSFCKFRSCCANFSASLLTLTRSF